MDQDQPRDAMPETAPPDTGADDAPDANVEQPELTAEPNPEPWAKVQIGETFRRSFAVFREAPLTFLGLGLIPAVGAAVGVAAQIGGGSVALGLVSIVAGLFTLLAFVAVTIAADAVAAGDRPSIGQALRAGMGRYVPTLVALVGAVLVIGGIVLVGLILATIAATEASAASASNRQPVGVGILILVAVVVLLVFAVRWSFFLTAVTLEHRGPLQGLSRSRQITKRTAWRTFWLLFAVGLVVGAVGAVFQALALYYVPSPVAVVLFGVTGLIGGVASPIALTIAFGGLTGRPWRIERTVPAAGRIAVAITVLAFVAAVALQAGAAGHISSLFEPNAGRAIFGRTAPSGADSCHPRDLTTTFAPGQPIYISAIFRHQITSADSVTVRVYKDGAVAAEAPLTAPAGQTVACYYETDPVSNLPAGAYRIEVVDGSEVISEGGFSVG